MGGGVAKPRTTSGIDWTFEQIDHNQDKKLSVAELVAAAAEHRIAADWPEARIKETVAKFDQDGDGFLDQSEWNAAFDALGNEGLIAERQLVSALAEARADPKGLASRLEQRLKHYQGKDYYPPERGGKVAVATKEGTKAVDEAIAYLRALTPLEGLVEPADDVALRALALACDDHLVDRGTLGQIGHEGADESHSQERLMRYGGWAGACGECLWFGRQGASAASMVEDLVVDDGVRSRGHRLCIFNEHYTVAAARVGAHKTFGTMAVIEFAAVFEGDAAKVAAREAAGAPKPSADAKARQETQWKGKIGLCVSCKQDIKGGSVMEVKGLGKFHKACFACVECAKGLVGVPWKAEKGRTFCADCHAQNFAPRCEACGEPITGSGVKVNGVPYHKEHKPTADGAAAAAPNATKGGGGGATAAVAKPKGKGKAAAAKPSFAGAKTDVGGLAADYGAF